MKISVKLLKHENKFIASCPELEINCYGASKTEATKRIKKVLSFYIDSAKELGFNVEQFDTVLVDGVYSGTLEHEEYFHDQEVLH